MHPLSLATINTRDEGSNFWQFLLHHPVSDLGIVAMFTGIIIGNMGIWKMMDAAAASTPRNAEMFSTGAETNPISPQQKRSAAVAKYRENHPNGPFYKMLRGGQVLTVIGALFMLVGAFI